MAVVINCLTLMIFTATVIGVYSQSNQQTTQVNATEVEESTSSNSTTTDSATNDALSRLMNASSIEDLLSMNILFKDGHVATAADLGAVPDPNTGKLMVSGGMDTFAVPDGCHPREVTVEIHEKDLAPTSLLYPRCVKVLRCGGCCHTPNVQCVPLYIERGVYNLVHITMHGSSSGLSVVGRYPLQIERHVSCKCECTLSQDKCGPNKVFNSPACSCHCLANVRCFPPKMFNPETCACECAVRQECCTDCNFEFNEDTCECGVISDRILSSSNNAGGNLTEYQRSQQAIMGGQSNSSSQQQPETTTSAATTTTPTTTTAAAGEDTTTAQAHSCSTLVCPAGFQKVNCACTINTRPRPRPRSRSRSRSSRTRSRN